MTNITLTGLTPVHAQNAYGTGYALQNNGPGTAYLDNYTSVTPQTGQALLPGVTIPIAAGTDLWACTDDGQSATLSWLAGSAGNGATVVEINGPVDIGEVTLAPGSEVGISGPVAISGSVDVSGSTIDVGGTVAVAGDVNANITNASIALAPGTAVDINAGTVDIGNIPGVTPFVASATLAGVSNINLHSGPYTSAVTNCAVYQSLHIQISNNSGTAVTASVTCYATLVITWLDGGGSGIFTEAYTMLEGATMVLRLQVKGASFSALLISSGSTAAPAALRYAFEVFGTTVAVPYSDEYYSHETAALVQPTQVIGINQYFSGVYSSAIPSATQTTLYFPSSVAGQASLVLNTSSGSLDILQAAGGLNNAGVTTNYIVFASGTATVSNVFISGIQIPKAPIAIRTICVSGTGMTFGLTYSGNAN